MSSTPELPNLDFLTSPEAVYNHEFIADNALWPLVNSKWQGDFRQSSTPNMPPFCFPKVGTHKGRLLTVTLEAGCDIDYVEEDDGESQVEVLTTVHDLSLRMEETTPQLVESLIALAHENDPSALEHWLEEDGDGISPEYELRAVQGLCYYFDTSGGFNIYAYRELQDIDGMEIWNSRNDEEEENELEDKLRFVEADLDNLLVAISILGAPSKVKKYLQQIKNFPHMQ